MTESRILFGNVSDEAVEGNAQKHSLRFVASQETHMAEITAKLVNDLRAKTGQGMMECKKALQETGGDVEKAIDYFRQKGVKTSLTERVAGEGRIIGAQSRDKKSAAIVGVNCNTDLTAKRE